jgi:hypothetical protein
MSHYRSAHPCSSMSFNKFKLQNVLYDLLKDLKSNEMSTDIQQDIGEIFIKHMFYKEYENVGNVGNVENGGNESNIEIIDYKNISNTDSNNNGNEISNNNGTNENETNENETNGSETNNNDINEMVEKRKLMKYLTMGWYVYTHLLNKS